MTVKEFFKSTSFKCIAALLAILLVCGVFLTIAYGFLEVTDEERFARAINKIYGQTVNTEQINLEGVKTDFDTATVSEAYKVTDDGNYLIKVAGKQGFGGSVICWVVVEMNDAGNGIDGIKKVTIDSAPGESYLSNISQDELDRLASLAVYGEELHGGWDPSNTPGKDYFPTGASRTMWAVSNAINGAMDFVAAYALGESVAEFYGDNGFEYLELIDRKATSYSVDNGIATYNITTLGSSPAGPFELSIVIASVDNNPTIKSVTIVKSGSVPGKGLSAEEYDEKIYNNYEGKTLQYFIDMLGEDMAYPGNNAGKDFSAGASRSSYNLVYACAFALANYDKCLEIPYGGDK